MSRDAGDVLDEQLLLLEEKKRQIPDLLRRGHAPGQEIADELVGIRFTILAALLQWSERPGAERNELERHEREARELLREVILPPLRERLAPGWIGGLASQLAAS